MTGILKDVPRRYWHDRDWLRLAHEVHDPTYFHILGIEPEAADNAGIEERALDLYQRLQAHAADLNNPSGQQIANTLLGIASTARQTLTDPGRGAAYVEQLQSAFDAKVRQLLQDWSVRTLGQLSPEVREMLMLRRKAFSLTQPQAQAIVDRVASELPDRTRPDVQDPAYPTYFDLLGAPETADDMDRDLIERNRDRLVAEREAQARKTTRGMRKRALLAEAHEIKSAAHTLLDRSKRLKHLRQARELRMAAFKAFVSDSVRPGQQELLASECDELAAAAECMRLGHDDVARVFAELALAIPARARPQATPFAATPTHGPGRLGPLPRVRMGSAARGRREFSFVIENVGDDEISVLIIPRHIAIKLYQRKLKLGPKCRQTVSGQLDTRGLSMGRYKLPIEVRGPGGGGLVQVYVRVASIRLPVLLSVAYVGVLVMGLMAGSAFLVHLSCSACIILAGLLWQRSRRWQYGLLGIGMVAAYFAVQRYVPDLRAIRSAPPAPMPRAWALSAEEAQDGILVTWQRPRPWTQGWTVRVLRKKGDEQPRGVNDGKLVFEGEGKEGFFEDREGIDRGERYTYAIFVCENGRPPRYSAGTSASVLFFRPPKGLVSRLPQGTLAVQMKALRQRWDARQHSIDEALKLWGAASPEVLYLQRHRSALSQQAAELAERLKISRVGQSHADDGPGARAAEVQRRVAAEMLALLEPCLPESQRDEVEHGSLDAAGPGGVDVLISPLPKGTLAEQTAAVRRRWRASRESIRKAEALYGKRSPEVWRLKRQRGALSEQTTELARQAKAKMARAMKAHEAMMLDGRPERDTAARAIAEDVYGQQLVFYSLAACLPMPARSKLLTDVCLPPGFVTPIEGYDQHGNTVATRGEKRSYSEVGWPYEIWLKEPRIEFVFVVSDELTMRKGRPSGGRSHKPQWFYLAKYEITQSQWEQVTGKRPWADKQSSARMHPSYPAVNVSWHDCQQFLAALGRIYGQKAFRLPTVEEWEHACRAGVRSAYCFGDTETRLKDYAWYLSTTFRFGENYAHAVGRKRPNAWGLYDMHGNAWEWCLDQWEKLRMAKGGAFDSLGSRCSSSSCQRLKPESRAANMGLRPLLPLRWESIDEECARP